MSTWAVIFTSTRTDEDEEGYTETAARMLERAAQQPGYLGVDLAPGITISYWDSEEAIAAWKADEEHAAARRAGRERWYASYRLRVARIEREYGFKRD